MNRVHRSEQLRALAIATLLTALPLAISTPVDAQAPDWAETLVSDTFSGPRGATTGDMDGDGDLDIVATAEDNDAINWMENLDGDGTSWAKRQITNDFPGAADVAVGDLDNDGDLDVAAVSPIDDDITVWENLNGLGTSWSAPITLDSIFEGAISVSMADIDDDGNLDIVGAAPDEDEVAWFDNYLGNGNNFIIRRPSETIEGARSPSAADLDNDGDLDIVAVAEGNSAITWVENLNGIGTSWAKNPLRLDLIGARDVTTGDLDGDGDIDVIGTVLLSDSLFWWENVGLGATWIEHLISNEVDGADSLEIGDIDGDGHLDIAVTAGDDNDILWFSNVDGDGSNWSGQTVEGALLGPTSLAIADLDGDTDLDIVATGSALGTVRWWDNDALLWTTGSCPGVVSINTTLAGPDHSVAILFSQSLGISQVPPGRPCFGTELGLDNAQFATLFTTDARGNATLTPTLVEASCGAFIQIVDLNTCEVSEATTIPE